MAKLQQFQAQKLAQKLKLELKPKMLQSLQMLAMPLLELELHLKNELVQNPLLEIQEDEEEFQPEEELLSEDVEVQKTLEEAKELSEILDSWREYHQEATNFLDDEENNPEAYIPCKEDAKSDFITQLERYSLTDDEYDFACDLIDSCDSYGFLPAKFQLDKLGEDYNLTAERSEEIHQIILHLTPSGITAFNIEECLSAQLDSQLKHYDLIIRIIKEDFTNLIHRRYQLLTTRYQVSLATVEYCRDQIAKLDPKPGLRIANTEVNYVVPDVVIRKVEDEFVVIVNDNYIPNIGLSRRYLSMIKEMRSDKETFSYVRGKINGAKFLIKSIYMRNRTLEKVTRSIIEHQRSFFYHSSGILEPLTYAAIANEIQVNESTISRVVKRKYADTPFGIMCLKDFFTSSAGKDRNYESVSRQQVQVLIEQFVSEEDKSNPLSDQELVKILKERGIAVSRRVVAKYREGMGILNSRLRRK